METTMKLVDFSYCSSCKYKDLKETEEPCNDCLAIGGRDDGSRKPMRYEFKEEEKSQKNHGA